MSGHLPVLLDEVLDLLNPGAGETFADCTAGLGGHAAAIASRVGAAGTVVLNDLDASNLERAEARVKEAGARVVAIHGSFAGLMPAMEREGLRADLLLADLGFASVHVDDPSRGFSFRTDAPLDMRYDTSSGVTAADLVASLSEEELSRLIHEFGEDRLSRRIARKLVEARGAEPIQTTGQLARIVRSASGGARGKDGIDTSTRTFQALRIAVNDEIGSLMALLASIERSAAREDGPLADGARIAIISFHSLEDRPVKQGFQRMVDRGRAEHIARRPVRAREEELSANPRARSAKLRAIRLLGGGRRPA